jgi:hypothetical protein
MRFIALPWRQAAFIFDEKDVRRLEAYVLSMQEGVLIVLLGDDGEPAHIRRKYLYFCTSKGVSI